MSANTETTGAPPKGYMKCGKKCGRYAGVGNWCWECRAKERPIDDDEREVTMLQYPDWTPPVAAPAAHVERRKGQRWKMVSTRITMEGTLGECGDNGMGMRWMLSDVVRSDGVSGDRSCFYFERWDQPEYTMSLLADAPPEPAEWDRVIRAAKSPPVQEAPAVAATKLLACMNACGRSKTCDSAVAAWICAACGAKRYGSAQEAPKAAPVWLDCQGCHVRSAGVILRVTRKGRAGLCDACMRGEEVTVWSLMAFESTGTPHTGPERLPKPQLAADWVEDCLGDVR